MKKSIVYSLTLLLSLSFWSGCKNDDPDGTSIFVDPDREKTSFDVWLQDNYVNSYNIRFVYRIEDIETDFRYNVIPADVQKSKQMAVLLKHLWLEPYEEVAEDQVHFIRSTAPKLFHLIGSAEHNAENGTIRLGVAEGGMKITITEVNALNPQNFTNQNFFGTVHHEFGHVLCQTKNYPEEFNTISVQDYAPTTWQEWGRQGSGKTIDDAYKLGFVTAYAGSSYTEDFVEVLARYLIWPREQWNDMVTRAGADGADGADKIEQKLEIVKNYMKSSWGVNIDELHTVVQRRAQEIRFIDFDNLDF